MHANCFQNAAIQCLFACEKLRLALEQNSNQFSQCVYASIYSNNTEATEYLYKLHMKERVKGFYKQRTGGDAGVRV